MLLQAERASYARTEYQGRAQARELVGRETEGNAFDFEGNRNTMGTRIVHTGGAEGSRVRDHADDDWEARRERYRGRDARSRAADHEEATREDDGSPNWAETSNNRRQRGTPTHRRPASPIRTRPLRDDEVPPPWRRPIRPMIYRLKLCPSHRTADASFEDQFHQPGEPYVPCWHEGMPPDEYDPDTEYYLSDRLPMQSEPKRYKIYPGQILPWQAEWLRTDRSVKVANLFRQSFMPNIISSWDSWLESGPTGPQIFEWFFRQRRRELQQQLDFMREVQLIPRLEFAAEDSNEGVHAHEYSDAFEQAAPAAQRQQRPRMRRPDLPRWLRTEISLDRYQQEHQERLPPSYHSEDGTEDDEEQSDGET